MENIFIYLGLAIVFIGCCVGVAVSVKGYRATEGKPLIYRIMAPGRMPKLHRMATTWFVLVISGLVVTGLGAILAPA